MDNYEEMGLTTEGGLQTGTTKSTQRRSNSRRRKGKGGGGGRKRKRRRSSSPRKELRATEVRAEKTAAGSSLGRWLVGWGLRQKILHK